MKSQRRHVLLFVDNAPSHPELQLSNISVKFLPPNTTSFTQPMGQGIIQSAKLKFRKRQMNHMVKEMDRQPAVCGPDLLKQINILDAIYWINNSWQEVQESTIQKCFQKAGFCLISPEENCVSQVVPNTEADDDIPLAVLKLSFDLFGCSFCDLATIDEGLQTCDTNKTDWERPAIDILNELNQCCESDSDEDIDDSDHLISTNVPTIADASNMINQLKTFDLHSGQSTVLILVLKLDDELSSFVSKSKKQ